MGAPTFPVMSARPIDLYGERHAYDQVADDIERGIGESEISVKLPAERSLAEEYGVADETVRPAMAILHERGVIITVHGRGTFARRQDRCSGRRRAGSCAAPIKIGRRGNRIEE
jgi:GntR family transcriptional regulator